MKECSVEGAVESVQVNFSLFFNVMKLCGNVLQDREIPSFLLELIDSKFPILNYDYTAQISSCEQ